MRVHLQYGTDGLDTEFPDRGVTVLAPRYVDGLSDEAAAFKAAVERPLSAAPLSRIVRPGERVAIVIPDITRPLPTARLLPWVLEALGAVDPEDVVIVNGTGSHRVNTPAELVAMVGEEVFARYRVVRVSNRSGCIQRLRFHCVRNLHPQTRTVPKFPLNSVGHIVRRKTNFTNPSRAQIGKLIL